MQYRKQSRINAAPAVVFAFHERTDALERLTPPWEKVRIVESAGSIRPGSRVVLETRIGLIPMRWVALHTEYEPPRLFADRQVSGPFASWYHRHQFEDDLQGGTLMTDIIDYELPMGRLGRLALGGSVVNKLDRLFAFRHDLIRNLADRGELANPA